VQHSEALAQKLAGQGMVAPVEALLQVLESAHQSGPELGFGPQLVLKIGSNLLNEPVGFHNSFLASPSQNGKNSLTFQESCVLLNAFNDCSQDYRLGHVRQLWEINFTQRCPVLLGIFGSVFHCSQAILQRKCILKNGKSGL
jgi:hypothetical protein